MKTCFHIKGFVFLAALLGATQAQASLDRNYNPVNHQQDWGFRASLGVGGFWGAPRVYARPISVGAFAECQWVKVSTPYGQRWQAICD